MSRQKAGLQGLATARHASGSAHLWHAKHPSMLGIPRRLLPLVPHAKITRVYCNSGTAAAADPVSKAQQMIGILIKSIEYEEQHQFTDAQGAVSSFASFSLRALQEIHSATGVWTHSSERLQQLQIPQQLQQAEQQMASYKTLPLPERQQLLHMLRAELLPQASRLLLSSDAGDEPTRPAAAAAIYQAPPMHPAGAAAHQAVPTPAAQYTTPAWGQAAAEPTAAAAAPASAPARQATAAALDPRRNYPKPRRAIARSAMATTNNAAAAAPPPAAAPAAAAVAARHGASQQVRQQVPATSEQQQQQPSISHQQQQLLPRQQQQPSLPHERQWLHHQQQQLPAVRQRQQQQQQQQQRQLPPHRVMRPPTRTTSMPVAAGPGRHMQPIAQHQQQQWRQQWPFQPQQQPQLRHRKQVAPVPAWQLYMGLPAAAAGGVGREPYFVENAHRPAYRNGNASGNGNSNSSSSSFVAVMGPEGITGGAAETGASAAEVASTEEHDDFRSSSSSSRRSTSSRASASEEQHPQPSDEHWHQFLAAARRSEQQAAQICTNGQQEPEQRSAAWHMLRQGCLTGSVLPNLMDWFSGRDGLRNSEVLWREKLKLPVPPLSAEAKAHMQYGIDSEDLALQCFLGLSHDQIRHESLGLVYWGDDEAHNWMSASPDGVITMSAPTTAADAAAAAAAAASDEVTDWIKQYTGSAAGVLEIKCPSKLKPRSAASDAQQMGLQEIGIADAADEPHKWGVNVPSAQWYYMPQVQLLCEVLDREWAVLYNWSEGRGSQMTLIKRDRDYFALLWQVMADFWWKQVIPAKLELQHAPPHIQQQLDAAVNPDALLQHPEALQFVQELQAKFLPPRQHPYAESVKAHSKALMQKAPKKFSGAKQTQEAGRLRAAAAAAVGHDAGRSSSGSTSGAQA